MRRSLGPRGDWYRASFDEAYPILYSHRDRKEAADFIARLSVRWSLSGGRILDLGCGTGRYLQAISTPGVQPVGVDLSFPLLKIARSHLPHVPLVRADMRRIPVRERSFAGVLLMFSTFGYFDTREEDLLVLREVARILEFGGRFVFDYVNSGQARSRLICRSGRLIREMCAEERRWIDPAGPFLYKETRLGPMADGGYRTYRERLRLYDPAEIEEMLDEVGLRVIDRWGDYRAGAFDPASSPRFLLLAMKEAGS